MFFPWVWLGDDDFTFKTMPSAPTSSGPTRIQGRSVSGKPGYMQFGGATGGRFLPFILDWSAASCSDEIRVIPLMSGPVLMKPASASIPNAGVLDLEDREREQLIMDIRSEAYARKHFLHQRPIALAASGASVAITNQKSSWASGNSNVRTEDLQSVEELRLTLRRK